MATLFTKAVTINAAGKDVVFDGIDFTEEALVTITGAQSVKITNCRIYNLKPNKEKANFMLLSGNNVKLMVDHCFFGGNQVIETVEGEGKGQTTKVQQIYNLFELNGTLANGSYCAENYVQLGEGGCCSHNFFNIYGAEAEATISVSGNEMIMDGTSYGDFMRIGVKGAVKCTINVQNNVIKCNKAPYYKNATIIQPYNTQTTSFKDMTVNYKDNVFPAGMIYPVQMYNGKRDTQITEELAPTIYIEGKKLEYKDLPYQDYYGNVYYPGRGEEGKFPEA